jgi:hypothetical protein
MSPEISGGLATLSFAIESREYGAILTLESGALPQTVAELFPRTATLSRTRLGDLSSR